MMIDVQQCGMVENSWPGWKVNHSQPSTIWQNLRHPFAVREKVSRSKKLSLHSPSTKQNSWAEINSIQKITNLNVKELNNNWKHNFKCVSTFQLSDCCTPNVLFDWELHAMLTQILHFHYFVIENYIQRILIIFLNIMAIF